MAKSSALSAKAFALAAQIEELELIEKGQQKRCSTKRKPFDSDGTKSKLEVNISEFASQLNKQARKAATDNMETVKVVQANPELKHKFEGALNISNSRLKYLMSRKRFHSTRLGVFNLRDEISQQKLGW